MGQLGRCALRMWRWITARRLVCRIIHAAWGGTWIGEPTPSPMMEGALSPRAVFPMCKVWWLLREALKSHPLAYFTGGLSDPASTIVGTN